MTGQSDSLASSQSKQYKSLYTEDGKLRLDLVPRCTATFSDGRTCKLPCCVLDKTVHGKDRQYTKHCYRHGGKQEVSAHDRQVAQSLTDGNLQSVRHDINSVLDSHDSHDSHDIDGNQNTNLLAPVEHSDSTCTDTTHHSSCRSDVNPKATGKLKQ